MTPEQRKAYRLLQEAGGELVRHTGGHGMWKLNGYTFSLPHHTTAWKGDRAHVYLIKTKLFIKRVAEGRL